MLRGLCLVSSLLVAVSAGAQRSLPDGPLLIAYPGDGTCDDKVITAVQSGLNVVIWSFINLGASATNQPIILVDQLPDLTCVAATAKKLEALNLTTTHMISIGGWGSPHPAITNDPSGVYASWKEWNEKVVPQSGFKGFDGVDWDLEGVNDLSSPDNVFTVACLDLVGKFSEMAKADGYLVSLVPPQSYFDVSTSKFNLLLTNAYPNYMPSFQYHGYNAYAYIVSKYGGSQSNFLFDFISVQLYESYSRALYNITVLGEDPTTYLEKLAVQYYNGWTVDFSSDPSVGWPSQKVAVPQSRLIIGLANGWSDGSRALLLYPTDVGIAYDNLKSKGLQPRGFMFWDIESEGLVPPGYSEPLYLASGLNAYLHVRN